MVKGDPAKRAAPKGRPKGKKKTNTVTLQDDEIHTLATALGYEQDQDLLDDLAMDLIPPTTRPVALFTAMPEVEGSRGSAKVAQPRSKANIGKSKSKDVVNNNKKRPSWGEVVEIEDAARVARGKYIQVSPAIAGKPEKISEKSMLISEENDQKTVVAVPVKTLAGVVKSDGAANISLDLKFVAPGKTMEFSNGKRVNPYGNTQSFERLFLLAPRMLMFQDG